MTDDEMEKKVWKDAAESVDKETENDLIQSNNEEK